MKPNFVALTLAQFRDVVARYPFKRKITSVHVHHTWRPTKADYRGISTIESMWRYHTEVKGWSDIAQHATIAPDGTIWTGRSWDAPPASSSHQNGTALAGPFMFETIGDFDVGREKLVGAQREAVIGVIAAIQLRHDLPADAFQFHRDLGSPKTCPGTGIKRDSLLEEVVACRAPTAGTRRRPRAKNVATGKRKEPSAESVDLGLTALGDRQPLRLDAVEAEDNHDHKRYAARVPKRSSTSAKKRGGRQKRRFKRIKR